MKDSKLVYDLKHRNDFIKINGCIQGRWDRNNFSKTLSF